MVGEVGALLVCQACWWAAGCMGAGAVGWVLGWLVGWLRVAESLIGRAVGLLGWLVVGLFAFASNGASLAL